MKTLYESILDDEDDILDDQSIAKELVIDFISKNYQLRNYNGRLLNISDYIKFNKDSTVDIKIKPGQYTELLNIGKGFTTNGLFRWGNVWNVKISCEKLTSLENLPTKCNMLSLYNMKNITDLSGLPREIHTLEMYNLNSIKDLTSIPKDMKIEHILVYHANKLKSLKGCPDAKEEVVAFDCPKLEEIPNNIHPKILHVLGDNNLSEEEKKKLVK